MKGSIFDLNGRRIAKQNVDGKTIPLAQAGAYVVQVKAASESRFVKGVVD